MAQCGKCGRDLPVVDGLAFDPGHYCQPLLPGYKQVIIVLRQAGDFDVCMDGKFSDRLSWGEMMETVLLLTHPLHRKAPYGLLTPQELFERAKRYGENHETIDAKTDIPY